MKKEILKNLYDGNFHEWDRDDKDFKETEEWAIMHESYAKLEKTFTKEQALLFNEYFLADGSYQDLRFQRMYANGFKVGFWLAMELMDFDPAD